MKTKRDKLRDKVLESVISPDWLLVWSLSWLFVANILALQLLYFGDKAGPNFSVAGVKIGGLDRYDVAATVNKISEDASVRLKTGSNIDEHNLVDLE